MPLFSYEARNSLGRPQVGAQEAASASALVGDLRQRGWLVLKVEPARAGLSWGESLSNLNPFAWLPPRSIDVELSFQQIAVMLRSGLTLLTALQALSEHASRKSMRRIWKEVAERIQQGASLSEAMAGFGCFPHVAQHLVKVGEQTGTLETVVARAAEAMERRRLLRTHLLTALSYPAIVVVAAIGVSIFMIVGIIPKIQVFLRSLGRQLPPMTQMLVDISEFIQTRGPWIAAFLVLLTGGFIALYLSRPGRLFVDRVMLRVPVVGRLLRLGTTVQFAHGLAVLLESGITLVEGLRTVEGMHKNRHVAGRVGEARTAVVQGAGLALSLERANVFMPLLPKMVAVGEAAGTLDDVLKEVAKFHEHQLQVSIRRLSVIIEPLIVVVVGGIVGFVYISFFMALFAAAGGR